MGFLLAAAPYEDFIRRNIPVMALIVFVILSLLIIRMVVKTMTKVVLLGLMILMVLFVYIEQDNITQCAQTCSCQIAGFDANLPLCDPNVV